MPDPLGSVIDHFILLINEVPTRHRILIVGDFNLDQMLSEHGAKVGPLIQNFNLWQHSPYSTYTHRGILDLDTLNFNTVSSMPSPYSNHFVLFSKSDALYLYRI